MAVWTLRQAPRVLAALGAEAGATVRADLDLRDEELAAWAGIARTMFVPMHADMVEQFAGFDALRPCDEAWIRGERPDRADWALDGLDEDPNDYRIAKQGDFLMLLYLFPVEEVLALLRHCGYALTVDQLRHTAHVAISRTTGDSSLTPMVIAGALAELDPGASWRAYVDGAAPALSVGRPGMEEGIPMGAMAGTLDVLQRRYLGWEVAADGPRLRPAIPPGLPAVRWAVRCRFGRFTLDWSGERFGVRADGANAAVSLDTPAGPVTLAAGQCWGFDPAQSSARQSSNTCSRAMRPSRIEK